MKRRHMKKSFGRQPSLQIVRSPTFLQEGRGTGSPLCRGNYIAVLSHHELADGGGAAIGDSDEIGAARQRADVNGDCLIA